MPFMVIYSTSDGARATSRLTPSTRPPSSSSASATRRGSRRSGSTGWRRSASRSGRTTRSSSGCRSDRRNDHRRADLRRRSGRSRSRRRPTSPPSPTSPTPDAEVAVDAPDATEVRRDAAAPRRPPTAIMPTPTDAGACSAADPPAGHPNAWSISAAIARASEADRPRPRPPRGAASRSAEQHAGAHPEPPGPSVPLDDLAHLHACRLPPRLEPRPLLTTLCADATARLPTARGRARRVPRRRADARAAAGSCSSWWSSLLGLAVLGASLVPVPYVTLRPGSTRPVTEQVLVEGAPSYPPERVDRVHDGQHRLRDAASRRWPAGSTTTSTSCRRRRSAAAGPRPRTAGTTRS